MSVIDSKLQSLNDSDIYSVVMFALYNLKHNPKYSTLSELAYVLDKKNLLSLCEYFGGLTITVPTIDELQKMFCLLTLYELVELEHKDFDEAIKIVGIQDECLDSIKSDYINLCRSLKNYEL